MIRKDGYYISEGIPWIDWHAGHKFEGVTYYLLKFLNQKDILAPTSSTPNIDEQIFSDMKSLVDHYELLDGQTLLVIFNPDSKWSVEKTFTILSPEILLDENLKEYRFVPMNE